MLAMYPMARGSVKREPARSVYHDLGKVDF